MVIAPYVVNYAADKDQMVRLFQSTYNSLNVNGKLILVVDLPEGKDLKRFGAVKSVLGEKVDGARIEIRLFHYEEFICLLNAIYFTPSTLEESLRSAGFDEVTWHEPIVSEEGMEKFGSELWMGYIESPELGYISATKG